MRSDSLRNPVILAVAALGVLGCALVYFVIETGLQRRTGDEVIRHRAAIISDLRTLQAYVADAESGQRGFLLTGDERYLKPYEATPTAIDALIRRLRLALASHPGDATELIRADQVARLVAGRLDQLRQGIALRQADKASFVSAGNGLLMMDQLRNAIDALVAEEAQRLNTWLDTRNRAQSVSVGVLAIGSALALGMMLVAGVLAVLFERASRQTRLALQAARDAAVSADRAKSQFLATASHDLRQPLHAMNLFISALRRRVSGEEATKLVANMASAAESMQMMFNSLLDVSKLHAGAIEPAVSDFPVQQVFDRLHNAFAASAAAKGLGFEIEPSAGVLRTDPVLLESILRNLISNAVRYTLRGEVRVTCQSHDGMARIAVSDTGPGIPADQIERAFEEFQRLDTSNAAERGLGLGLAIVRRMARLLDLPIEIGSDVGTGSTFSVLVPLAADHSRVEAGVVEPEPLLVGRRVLLVDDDPLVRAALAREIADWGARITVGASAEAALWALGAEPPDVAIVDRDLGEGASGIELLSALQARFGVSVPAVVVTGATDVAALDELRRSGTPWLTKPLDAQVLRAKVAELLATARTPMLTG